MPEPWDRERIVSLIERLLEFLDAADLDDGDADAVCDIVLPKLWRRSGLDVFAFRVAVSAALFGPAWTGSRRAVDRSCSRATLRPPRQLAGVVYDIRAVLRGASRPAKSSDAGTGPLGNGEPP